MKVPSYTSRGDGLEQEIVQCVHHEGLIQQINAILICVKIKVPTQHDSHTCENTH